MRPPGGNRGGRERTLVPKKIGGGGASGQPPTIGELRITEIGPLRVLPGPTLRELVAMRPRLGAIFAGLGKRALTTRDLRRLAKHFGRRAGRDATAPDRARDEELLVHGVMFRALRPFQAQQLAGLAAALLDRPPTDPEPVLAAFRVLGPDAIWSQVRVPYMVELNALCAQRLGAWARQLREGTKAEQAEGERLLGEVVHALKTGRRRARPRPRTHPRPRAPESRRPREEPAPEPLYVVIFVVLHLYRLERAWTTVGRRFPGRQPSTDANIEAVANECGLRADWLRRYVAPQVRRPRPEAQVYRWAAETFAVSAERIENIVSGFPPGR